MLPNMKVSEWTPPGILTGSENLGRLIINDISYDPIQLFLIFFRL
jgi:hypothetical protein